MLTLPGRAPQGWPRALAEKFTEKKRCAIILVVVVEEDRITSAISRFLAKCPTTTPSL